MSPTGDCEKVTQSGGLPRCPDGDCEQVSSGGSDENTPARESTNQYNDEEKADISTFAGTTVTQVSGCKGSADCFKGIVTKIVDGDTIDVNNVRVRLSMVNTPENGEVGYSEAIETTKSVCAVGSNALVDEDDGQKEGSFDRLIGVVYCNNSTTSVNQVLLEEGRAIVYEDFCGVSEFANDKWVKSFGC
jgi:endonuclease YncB( thermonuclease family)